MCSEILRLGKIHWILPRNLKLGQNTLRREQGRNKCPLLVLEINILCGPEIELLVPALKAIVLSTALPKQNKIQLKHFLLSVPTFYLRHKKYFKCVGLALYRCLLFPSPSIVPLSIEIISFHLLSPIVCNFLQLSLSRPMLLYRQMKQSWAQNPIEIQDLPTNC
jgi:hypothetical protein